MNIYPDEIVSGKRSIIHSPGLQSTIPENKTDTVL